MEISTGWILQRKVNSSLRCRKKVWKETNLGDLPTPSSSTQATDLRPLLLPPQILQGSVHWVCQRDPVGSPREALKRSIPCGLWDWLCRKGNWIQIIFRHSRWILQEHLGISSPPVFDGDREEARWIGKEVQGPQNIRLCMDCPTLLLLAHVPPKH